VPEGLAVIIPRGGIRTCPVDRPCNIEEHVKGTGWITPSGTISLSFDGGSWEVLDVKRVGYLSWWLLALGVTVAAAVYAQPSPKQFSADIVQQGPKGQVSSGKMYVGDNRTRMEMSQQGQEIVRITDQNRHVEWILFPKQHKYMERQLPPGPAGHGVSPQFLATDPCAAMPGVICKNLGKETIDGRKAVKWEMETTHQGKTMKSVQWIDKERGLPLRQEFPNGQTMELKYSGPDLVDGRKVEKWEMVTKAPNRPPMRAEQWYDPKLNLVIRQEFPGEFSSELKNIKVGKQPDHLFAIPAGYERVSQPQGMPGQPGGER
jgi:outer membrane lipoprotein-sorting protein